MIVKNTKKINRIISDKEAKNTKVKLQIADGQNFGEVSASAYSAIRGDYLDKYSPVDDNEKKVLDAYKKYASNNTDTEQSVEVNSQKKKDGIFSWLGKNAMSGLAQFNKGIAETLDFIIPTDFLGKYDYISKLSNYYSGLNEGYTTEAKKASSSRGKGWVVAGDVLAGTIAAAPNAILAAMSGGASLAANGVSALSTASSSSSVVSTLGQAVKTMAKNPSYWTSVMRTLGTDYEEAKERGANELVATASAIITTALNAGIEVGGGIEALPKNLKSGSKGLKNAVRQWAKSTLEEGGEEVLQGITTNIVAKLMYDHDAPIYSTTDDKAVFNPVQSAKEFGMGLAVGGLLGGGQATVARAVNTSNIIKTGKYFNQPDAIKALIDTGLESPTDTESYKLATKAQNKKGKLSNYEIGRLYYANVEQLNEEEALLDEHKNATSDNTVSGTISDSPVHTVADIKNVKNIEKDESISKTNDFIDELDEISKSEPVTRFAPQNSSKDMETFETQLIYNGLSDVDRQSIINDAIVLENSLKDFDVNFKSAISGITKLTNNVMSTFETNTGGSANYWSVFDANLKALSETDTNVTDEAFVRTYTNTFADILKYNNSVVYNELSKSGDVGAIVADYLLTGRTPTGVNSNALINAASKLSNVIKGANVQIQSARSMLYKKAGSTSDAQSVMSINEQNMPVTEENTTVNEHIESENVISHTKEFKGMKLVDIQESTLYGGKTLLTGVYELNIDKDFNRKSYKKENFDILLLSEPWIKNVNGTTYGHYAFTKTEAKSYIITYLPAGQGVAKVDGENKARAAIKVLDERKPELPFSVQAYGDDGVRCFGGTRELVTEINEIINSATENADEITLPFKSKKDLITYLKQHKGDKIGVSYNDGAEDIRTIISASDAAIVTERTDGQRGRLSAKSNELSYTEDGFVYTGDNGITVSYRFIAEDISIEERTGVPINETKVDKSDIERPESVTKPIENVKKQADSVTETPDTKKKLKDVCQQMVQRCYNPNNKDYKYYGKKGVKVYEKWRENPNAFYEWAINNGYKEGLTIDRINPDGNYEPDNCRWVTMAVNNANKSVHQSDIRQTGDDIVNSSDGKALNLTDKCELVETKHTATGNDIWVVTLKDRLSSEEYKDLNGKIKGVGGYYSRFAKTPAGKSISGFVFKTKPTEIELNVFNDFFGYTDESTNTDIQTVMSEKITVDMSDDARAELLNKKSVNVVSVDAENTKALSNIDLDALQSSYPSYARPIIKKIARDFGILNKLFFNPDIELEFSYSGDSIQESINKQHSRYGDFVKMLSVFSDVIENAVGIETHKDKYNGTRREDTNLKQMYVLASAFSDEKGVYPVKLEVKEFKKNTNKLYLSVVLAKKESRHLSGNLGQNQLNTAPPTSTISISDLVGIVNPSEGDFLKYFPNSMLDGEQIEGKNKALAKETEKVENLKKSLNDNPQSNNGIKEIDVNSLLGAVENAKVGDEIKLSDYEKQSSTEQTLKNEPESDIIEKNTDKESAENVESQSEVLDRESKSNGRGLHTGAENETQQDGVESTDGIHREDSGKGLSESVRTDGNRPDDRNDSEGIYGTDDADDAVSEVRGNSAEITDSEPETIDTVVKTIEKKRPSNKGNFVITDDIAAEFDNTAPSARDNIEAIEMLLKLENEGRPATAEEKKILAKYKGWGGIDPRHIPYELSSRFGQLFDWEQRKAMQSSSNNAFFTPTGVIDAMYNGLKRMGFKGGNVLENSMGVGNFFGRMPSAMSAKSALTGVELESYTARIAQYLYPGATVINMPFQDVAIKNGSYDLVIGNVPFGTNKISYNKKKYSLHNYFIISSLDKVRDGGIVAVITSAGTLDSHSLDARAAIMDRADVVACYKLPEKVFSRNASTDVQSDLLILRKRSADEKPKGDSILNTITTAQGFRINEYFDKHPENVLGTLAKGHNAWGEITTILNDGNFYVKLNAAMKKLPKDLISGKIDLKPIETIVSLSDKPRFFEKNGKVYADDGAGTATEVSKNQANTVRDYIAVRDAYKELLNAYDNGETVTNADGTATIREMSDEDIKPLRDALSKAYDNFYKKHGAITGDGKKKIGTKKSTNNTFLEADADYYLVGGLERYDAKNSTFAKSALFEKDTLRKKRITSVDVASDALAVSLNESGRIDFARMQELTGKTEKQLAEELKGEIVLTPDGEYVLTDIYLSGNIYEKLDAVKNKPEFKAQQKMLEKVIPTPKDASEITVKLGANYIDTEYIEQFAREILSTNLTIRKDVSGRWVIEGVKQSRYGDIVNVKYGCAAFNGVQLLEKILNDGEITATKKVGTGRDAVTVFDPEMTDIARQKADDIRDAFETWIFANTDRRTKIVDTYNRTYNNYRPLDYERIAEKLSFDSMDEVLKSKLYPHQKKGIARFLFGGNILFAHGVGTGKTFEMIASVMEAKRMGIINKAAMVVPNNKVVDFKNDIAQAYPNAKVLVIDTANKKRQTMLGLVNSNDWDIVLIARTTFTKIPISPEFQTHYIAQQLEDLELQIAEAENDRSVSKRQLKGMITQRDNLEQKIKDLDAETKRDTNSVDFEKLGIDCICVDEAHNYKSIMTPTKLDIKGLVNRNNAQMANDMLMKLDYLRSIDGKIIFGTGTPITNTVSEIYNMMRMVRPDILEDAGIHSLDEWVNTFAKIETTTEIGIDNQIKNKSTQVIRSFINVSEMIGMFRQFADIVFTTDVVKNLPKAVYKDVELVGTDEHRQIEQQISSVIATAKKADLLKVYGQLMSMADVASVDLRMLAGAESEYNPFKDYSLDELEYSDSKINTMCDNVYEEYKASEKIKGTQIIFCDKGSGSGTVYSFNLHKDIMQKLVERGIPEEQIVIIKNQSDAQLEALYEKVNNGEVRVLIGTSQKMAEGLNVQKRVVAIHHPTVTYKPSDKEQGDARGVRAGNINDEVHIYRYLQKNTFDSHKWQAQDRKGEMINRALRGEVVTEMEDIGADEDSGAGVDAATAMAITSGNPLVKEKIDIDKEVVRLKTLQRNYLSEVYIYQDAISKNPDEISRLTRYAGNIEQDIALRNKFGEKASIVIKGKTFEKQTEANKALSEAVKTAPKNGQYTKLGTYNGFDIMFKGDTGGMNYSVILKGANEYSVEYAGNGNIIARFAGVLNRLDAELQRVRNSVETLKTDLEFARQEVKKPFEKEKELAEALEKQKDITYRYEHYSDKPATNAETSDADNSETVQSSRDLASGDSAERWTTERVEGNEGKGVNLADIVRSISKKFDIPIATGKVTDSEASGIYKRKAETIRTRIANNLPTISHELGHHLDKDYNFSSMESVELLKSSLPAEFLEQYEEADRDRETVAEFVRVYLKNTNDANRLCPEFYADFISTLSKEDLKSLNEIAASVNEYLSYNISERYAAAITTSKKQEKLSFKEKWQRLYTSWVDAFHPQKEAVDYVEKVTGRTLSGKGNAYVLATNSLNAHTIANYLICEGFRDLDGNVVDAKSFVDSIGMVDSKNVALLDKYLVLRHSLEWIAPTESDVAPKRVFADDTLENVEEIEKQIAQIEAEHPEIKTAAENLYEYQNNVLRHFVIPAGGMSEETLDMLNRKYPSYVPFYRAVGKKSGMVKGTFVNQRSPIMRAKGSGALILSPVESIIRNTEKMVKLALRNQTARVLSSYADTVDGFGQFMEAIPPDMIPHSVNIVKSKETFTDALQQIVSSGEDYFAVSDLFEQIFGNEVTDFTPVANANKRIVTVLQDGRPTYYQIHDEALYNAVAELAPQQANGYVKWATKIMQPMKLLITQNNPIFAVTNAIRDFGTAYKLSEVNNLAVFAAQYVKALGGIITNNADYKRYKAMGGGHSSELSANIDNIARTLRTVAHKNMGKARRLAYSLFVHPVETVAMFNDAIESVPRFTEFQRTLKEGGDLQEAIFNASDITTNFKRSGGGVGVKIANSTFMFNNAAIQGIDKTFRTLTNKDTKKRYRTLLKWLLHALLVGIIGYIYNKEVDEEGYKNLSSYKKNNFYNFAIGDGKFISLPKPRENALLDTFTERAIEYAFGNENAFYDFSTYLGGLLIPPMIPDDLKSIEDAAHSWLGGTVLGGIVDVGFNQDFKDTPIEGAYDTYTPSHERYTESTTKLSYALGQTRLARKTDMSPKKIDHLLSSYTGILGQINKALFPMNEERKDTSIGLRNKFISDSNYSTDVLNKMYENQEKAKKAFQYSGSVDDAVTYEQNAIITSYISSMNKAVKALPAEEQRNGRSYLLKTLRSWNYNNTASQAEMLNRFAGESVSDGCVITSVPKSTLEWSETKKDKWGRTIKGSDGKAVKIKYSYQMTPQEYSEYVTDYLNLVEKYRLYQGKQTSSSADYTSALEATKTEVNKVLSKKYKSKYSGKVTKTKY